MSKWFFIKLKFKKDRLESSKNKGFTLMELLVVLAIFTIIMSVALFNQSSLSSSVLVTNLAYETALAVREAQTYGISVRASSATAPDAFDKGYGAYFEINSPDRIVVFGDANNDKVFEQGELQSLYEIKNQRGNKIKGILYGASSVNSLSSGDRLSIMFKRPNPEAAFYKINSSGGTESLTGPIKIIVGNTENTNCRAIVVEVTGQISVEKTNCTP